MTMTNITINKRTNAGKTLLELAKLLAITHNLHKKRNSLNHPIKKNPFNL